MTDSWELEAFDWLSKEQWSVDKLIGPYLNGKGCCKVCDIYIAKSDLEQHVKAHLKEYEKLNKKKKRASDLKRKESLRLAREKRKNKKDREKQERDYRDYKEGEVDE